MKNNFIRCSDPETIQKLLKAGFQKVNENNGVVIFLNDANKKIDFDKSKIAFTKIMTAS